MTFAERCDEFSSHSSTTLSVNSQRNHRMFSKHLRQFFGDRNLIEIHRRMVEEPQFRSWSLNGMGTTPLATFSATNLTFSSQTVGTTSYPQTMNLTNTGTPALTFTVTVNGDFVQTNNCPASLAPSASCTFTGTFTPTTGGREREAWS